MPAPFSPSAAPETPLAARLRAWLGLPEARELLRSRLFWAGVGLKLILGTVVGSYYLRELFIPFVNYFVESGFANPWRHFAELERWRSFPYPPVMLYVMAAPRAVADAVLPSGVDVASLGHLLVMRLPLLACDVLIVLLLLSWLPGRGRQILLLYWWSPLVIYVCFWHGQLDVVPTALFLLSLQAVRKDRPLVAMALYGVALASKSHLLVALPFYLVYLRRPGNPLHTVRLLGAMLATYGAAVLPFALDPGFQKMVYLSPEQARVWSFQLPVATPGPTIVLAPLAILLLVFRFDAYPKHNWDLFITYLGITFCVLVTLAPPQPGYILWFLPFFVYFASRARQAVTLTLHVYAAAFLAYFAFGPESDVLDAWRLVSERLADAPSLHARLVGVIGEPAFAVFHNFVFTVMVASMAGMVLQMYLVGVRSNEVYRLRTRPVLIGLAGDSGAGKDTLYRLLADALGEQRTLNISGDDYHRWPRGHEMWQIYTHLDVRANELHRQHADAVAISRGETLIKGVYDHSSGQFTEAEEVDPRQYVVFSGLHALALDSHRRLYDLSIFLDPDESLRRSWKVRRDVGKRGHRREDVLRQLDERDADRRQFILPQRLHADLVVRLMPAPGADLEQLDREPETVLEIEALNSFNLEPFAAALSEVDSVAVEHVPEPDARTQTLRISGTVASRRLAEIAAEILPNLHELSSDPRLHDDRNGCLQLVLLICLDEIRRWPEPRG